MGWVRGSEEGNHVGWNNEFLVRGVPVWNWKVEGQCVRVNGTEANKGTGDGGRIDRVERRRARAETELITVEMMRP